MNSEEKVFFSDSKATVTNARIVLGGVTYAMANITSVRAFTTPKTVGLLLLGCLMACAGLFCVKMDVADSSKVGLVLFVLGLVLAGSYFFDKPRHWVRIGTAGAETNAIFSHEAAWTNNVVEAINDAIVSRS